MYVYNDITTDARVQRAASALSEDFELTLISTQKGKSVSDKEYNNILVGGRYQGALNIVETIFAAWRIIRKQSPDIVYCHDYYSAILAYLLIKTKFPGKLVYDAHELMIPENGRNDRRLNFFYWFEKRIVKRVNLLICASEQRGDIMKEHYELNDNPIVVQNISQLQINDDDPEVKNILDSLKDFFCSSKITVVYAGAVTSSRRIDVLLSAVISMPSRYKLLIIGKGDALETMRETAATHPELTSAFTGVIPYKCLGSILSRCDIGFLYYPSDTLNNRNCASNKIFEYASVGLPMLANENPTVMRIFKESHLGVSTDKFEEGLTHIAEERDFYKDNCLLYTLSNQWKDEAERLKQAISAIFEREYQS